MQQAEEALCQNAADQTNAESDSPEEDGFIDSDSDSDSESSGSDNESSDSESSSSDNESSDIESSGRDSESSDLENEDLPSAADNGSVSGSVNDLGDEQSDNDSSDVSRVSVPVSDGDGGSSGESSDLGRQVDSDELPSDVSVEVIQNDNLERNVYVYRALKKWSLWGVSALKVDELLRLLKPIYSTLPRTQRTLLRTPYKTNLQEMGDGLFWYKGIDKNLQERLTNAYVIRYQQIRIDISVDSVELFRNSAYDKFWALMGCLVDSDGEPFIIAVFCGEKDPNIDEFLQNFVAEVRELKANGYQFLGTIYNFQIRHYVMDALARQYVKRIRNHNHAHGCEKCTVVGVCDTNTGQSF